MEVEVLQKELKQLEHLLDQYKTKLKELKQIIFKPDSQQYEVMISWIVRYKNWDSKMYKKHTTKEFQELTKQMRLTLFYRFHAIEKLIKYIGSQITNTRTLINFLNIKGE